MLKRVSLTALLACITLLTFAQNTATIKGFVYDKASGEPMIFTNVVLEGEGIGVQTDVNGYFSMSQLAPGTYTLFTSLVGFDTAKSTVTVKAGDIITTKLFLLQRAQELKGVEVSARKTERQTQINAGVTSITPREMKLLPSSGGEPDLAQFLQVVPGVVFTGDQGGQLYIRGGSPAQTGILLDGVTIYNPFHSIGLYSVFETDAIRNVDVYSAGFSAEYGNRTSAILDVRTKDGNKNRLSGKVSVSPIMARAMLEGPLSKPKKEGGSSISFLLSAKHSYLNQTSKSVYGFLGEPFESGLPYSFTDLYGKVTFSTENGSKLNVFGFNFDDKAQVLNPVTDAATGDFHWKAAGGGATFVVTPGSSSALISGRFAYSRYDIDFEDLTYIPTVASAGGGRTRSSGIDGFEAAIDFTYYLPRYSQLKYGFEVSGLHTSLNYFTEVGTATNLDLRNTSAAPYILYRKNFGEKFIFEPSFRLQYYSKISVLSPEPRLGMKYNITPDIRLKFATGMYSQNIISTKSDRDIVNFFSGFVLSPDERVLGLDGENINNTLQRAYHVLGGIEVDVQDVEFNLEPWYKNFTRNIELSRIKVSNRDGSFTSGNGLAYGIDFSARYNKNKWYLWGVVSYQKITYETLILQGNRVQLDDKGELSSVTQVQTYPPPFDRRINTNLLAAYTTGKNKDWEISARFNYGSAFPFTQTQGFYEEQDLNGSTRNNTVNTGNGSISLLYADQINGGRLSDYHRLDVSAKKKFTLSPTSNVEATFSLSNVYNRNNIFYVDRIENIRIYQLPIFPSINVTWNF